MFNRIRLALAHSLVLCFTFIFHIQLCFAGTDLTVTYSGNLTYSGAADSLKLGEQIGSTWIATGLNKTMCEKSGAYFKQAYVTPVAASTGMTTTIDGIAYHVFDSGLDGIGWVMGVKDTNASNYSALNTTTNQWYPAAGTSTNGSTSIGGYIKITFIKTTTHLSTGVTTIPAQNLAQISCYDANGALADSAYIKRTAKAVTVSATGCSVQTPSSTTLNLGSLNAYDFPSIGSTSTEKNYTVSLSCDSNIVLKATVSDQTDTTNTSNVVSLTADSTATGLGVQVLYNNSATPVNLGPDNSSAGNTNQFDITTINSANQIINTPFSFRYVRTGPVTAGTANALVGVTFSYQ